MIFSDKPADINALLAQVRRPTILTLLLLLLLLILLPVSTISHQRTTSTGSSFFHPHSIPLISIHDPSFPISPLIYTPSYLPSHAIFRLISPLSRLVTPIMSLSQASAVMSSYSQNNSNSSSKPSLSSSSNIDSGKQ